MGQIKTVKDENKLKENQIALLMKEAEKLRSSNEKKVTRFQTEINEFKESKSDNYIDINCNNKTNNSKQKATDRGNKYNEKVK